VPALLNEMVEFDKIILELSIPELVDLPIAPPPNPALLREIEEFKILV